MKFVRLITPEILGKTEVSELSLKFDQTVNVSFFRILKKLVTLINYIYIVIFFIFFGVLFLLNNI